MRRSAYVDADVWAAERERLFAPEWVCVGRDEDVADAPGSYRLVSMAGERALLVRQPDGSLAAMANVCAHRGAELVDSTCAGDRTGRFDHSIRCAYHLWSYALDGSLRATPHLTTTTTDATGLHRLGLHTWGGFVFVQHQPGVQFALAASPGAQRIVNYPLADLRRAAQLVYDVAANWKVLSENYNECYHCGPVHPELCRVVPAFRHGGGNDLDWSDGIPHADGADTFTASGTSARASFPGLSAAERTRHKGELFYPNLWVSLSRDHVAAFTLWPAGPAQTRVVCDFLFHPDEIAGAGFDPCDAVDFWDTVNRQDWAICERVQRGMTSRHFDHGWYSPLEDWSLDLRRWWQARMGGAG